jgi:predicted RNA-binding Zn-ribbon protein involved in translation (DUF1610 family)
MAYKRMSPSTYHTLTDIPCVRCGKGRIVKGENAILKERWFYCNNCGMLTDEEVEEAIKKYSEKMA